MDQQILIEPGSVIRYLSLAELESGLDEIRRSPADGGVLELIVRRPATNQREVLPQARLDSIEGLVGDRWATSRSWSTADGSPHADMQINLMNSRVIALVAGNRDRWQLAGDQLYIDLDLSASNVPAGTRIALGSAILEVTAEPHTGCKKFQARFGPDAVKFVNSPLGKQLRLRGLNAKVIQSGLVRVGDIARKLSA